MPEPRVLVIEDDEVLRVLIFTVLRHQPLSVDTASAIDEGLEKISSCDYAMILIDMDIEEGSGEEFLRRFRQIRPEATSFVVAIRTPGDRQPAGNGLVSAYVNKPVEITTLAEVVRECAAVVPPPGDPLPCPPSESELRAKLERGYHTAN